MANSGIVWIDLVFDWCVTALVRLGEAVGLSYEEINVWLFVIAWPVVTLVMAWVIWRQGASIQRLKRATSIANTD